MPTSHDKCAKQLKAFEFTVPMCIHFWRLQICALKLKLHGPFIFIKCCQDAGNAAKWSLSVVVQMWKFGARHNWLCAIFKRALCDFDAYMKWLVDLLHLWAHITSTCFTNIFGACVKYLTAGWKNVHHFVDGHRKCS